MKPRAATRQTSPLPQLEHLENTTQKCRSKCGLNPDLSPPSSRGLCIWVDLLLALLTTLFVFAPMAFSQIPTANAGGASGSDPVSGSSASISWNYSPTSRTMNISGTVNNSGEGGAAFSFWIVDENGAQIGQDVFYRNQTGSYSTTLNNWDAGVIVRFGVTWNGSAHGWGLGQYVKQARLTSQTCKAIFPAVSNDTAYAIHYRLVHSIDGEVMVKKVAPGTMLPESTHTVTCGGTYRIEYQVPDQQGAGDGVWFLPDGEADPDGNGWKNPPGVETPDAPEDQPDAPKPDAPDPKADDGKPLPPAPKPPAPPWDPNKPPTTDSERLDKATYREGVNKIVGELQEQTKLQKEAAEKPTLNEAKEKSDAAEQAQKTAIAAAADSINNALPSNFANATAAPSTQAAATDDVYTWNPPDVGSQTMLGGSSLRFSLSDVAPNWRDLAAWFREAVLFCCGIAFCWFCQRLFEQYYLAWWGVTEKTTKPEVAQMTVPGAGWGKQLATVLTITAAFVGCIAAAVAAVNTQLASLIGSGTTITNAANTLTGSANSIFGAFTITYKFMNAWLPIAAIMQYCAIQYIIRWTVAPLWTIAFAMSKYFHV